MRGDIFQKSAPTDGQLAPQLNHKARLPKDLELKLPAGKIFSERQFRMIQAVAKKTFTKKLGRGAKDIGRVDASELRQIALTLRDQARRLDEYASSFEMMNVEPFDAPQGNLKNGLSQIEEWSARYIIPVLTLAGVRTGRKPSLMFEKPK